MSDEKKIPALAEPAPKTFHTANHKVAIKPVSIRGLEAEVRNGFATAKQKTAHTRAEVAFPNFDMAVNARREGLFLTPGDVVLVNSSHVIACSSNPQKLGDVEFVIIEESQILGVEKVVLRQAAENARRRAQEEAD
jgi:hypothetical protein